MLVIKICLTNIILYLTFKLLNFDLLFQVINSAQSRLINLDINNFFLKQEIDTF